MHLFIGFLIAILGFALIIYREKVKGFTGDIGFAEQYLGVGGTYTFLLILGIATFIFGLMWATGSFQSWFIENLGRYFGYETP